MNWIWDLTILVFIVIYAYVQLVLWRDHDLRIRRLEWERHEDHKRTQALMAIEEARAARCDKS